MTFAQEKIRNDKKLHKKVIFVGDPDGYSLPRLPS